MVEDLKLSKYQSESGKTVYFIAHITEVGFNRYSVCYYDIEGLRETKMRYNNILKAQKRLDEKADSVGWKWCGTNKITPCFRAEKNNAGYKTYRKAD